MALQFHGKSFEFYRNAQANVVNQPRPEDIVVLPTANSTLTCEELLKGEESAIASGAGQFSYAPLPCCRVCLQRRQDLANQLNYVPYVGSSFGSSTSSKVLVVGDNLLQT